MKKFRYLLTLCAAGVAGFSAHAMPIGMRIAMMGRAAARKQMVDTPKELKAGVYFKATLSELGYDVPTNGVPYSVTALGLPSGLTLKYNAAVTKKVKGKTVVVKKAKSEWWIEGVPTAAMDFFTNPPYLVITTNGQTEPYALPMEVKAQEVMELDDLALGQSLNEQFYLPGVTNGWTVSGLPTGLKYTAKLLTTKKKVGKKTVVTTNALPYAVYGKTTKAGLFAITAKKKVGAFYETMKYRVLVQPTAPDSALFGENLTNITTMAYEPVMWDLEDDVAAVGGKVAKVTGLPPGVAMVGQMVMGKPTKVGTYVVTFTKNVKSGKKTVAKTAQILWGVEPNDVKVELGFNTAGGVIENGVVGLKYGDLLAFSATSNATVTASGLPAGIKLVKVEDGSGGHAGRVTLPGEVAYAFTGFTAKAGTYLVTVKATLKGKTVTQRLALKVEGLPAWAKGTFNGVVYATGETPVVPVGGDATGETPVVPEDAQAARSTNGLATVTVSSVGKISGKFQEFGTNWTFTAASYTAAVPAVAGRPPYQVVESGTRDACPYQELICSNVVAKYAYKVTETVKGKKKSVTKYLERTFNITVSPVPVVPDVEDGPVRGVVRMEEVRLAEDGSPHQDEDATVVEAWQNLWGSTYKAVGKALFSTKSGKKTLAYKTFAVEICTNEVGEVLYVKAGDDKTGLTRFAALSLTVTTAGAVTATLTYDTGKTKKDPKTKKTVKVYYKATCSTVVIPTSTADAETFAGEVPLYFAPSAGNRFEGFAGSVVVQ